MFRHITLLVLFFALAVALIAPGVSVAADKKKSNNDQRRRQAQAQLRALEQEESVIRKQIQQLEKQIPQLKKNLTQFQRQAKAVQGQAQMAKQQLDQTKLETKRVSDELKKVTESVIDDQPDDSPFGKIHAAYLKSQQTHTELLEEIKNSNAYRTAYREAAAEAGPHIIQLRKRFFDDNPTVISAREEMASLKRKEEALRMEILRKDPDWAHASNNLKAAKEHEQRVDIQTKSVLGRYATAVRQMNSTKSAITNLQAKVRQGQQVLSRTVAAKNNAKRQVGNTGGKNNKNNKKRR